jgi:peptidoglycan/LPS O-acetylase OafA/YrhL
VSLRQGALYAALILGLAALERRGVVRLGRYAAFAGAVSYPLYILHGALSLIPDTQLTKASFSAPAAYGLFFGELVAVYLIAALVTVGFDQPAQRLLRAGGRRIGGLLRRPAAAGA